MTELLLFIAGFLFMKIIVPILVNGFDLLLTYFDLLKIKLDAKINEVKVKIELNNKAVETNKIGFKKE